MHRQPTELTVAGVKKLQGKLRLLKNRHKSLTLALQEGSDSHDLLDIKRIERDLILSDIAKIQTILSNMTILVAQSAPERAAQGIKVTYQQDNIDLKYQITLVDPLEADPFEGFVSVLSPIGSSLLGHGVGDRVTVATTKGCLFLTITDLE